MNIIKLKRRKHVFDIVKVTRKNVYRNYLAELLIIDIDILAVEILEKFEKMFCKAKTRLYFLCGCS